MELFRIWFLEFRLIDLVDIVIVTFIIYNIYQLLKNTITVQILLAIVFVLGVYFITELVNLRSLNWILRSLSTVWLIAFIILFQPELRRLLLQITRLPFFRFFFRSRLHETVDEVMEAVEEMSEKHIGALIVFARSRNIRMTIDTGIPIQGKLTRELLLAVFNTRSPLHDGAVIVQNGIVEAAGCILPLSGTTKLTNKKLGTRHRAALGISEQADVLVLVVSEETGKITLAEEGKFLTNLSLEELEVKLKERLEIQAPANEEKPLFSLSKSLE